jgi:hypothetical protein
MKSIEAIAGFRGSRRVSGPLPILIAAVSSNFFEAFDAN